MPTKFALDDDLLAEAVKLGGHGTKLETINEALREYIARRKRQAAIRAFGTFDLDDGYDHKSERRRR